MALDLRTSRVGTDGRCSCKDLIDNLLVGVADSGDFSHQLALTQVMRTLDTSSWNPVAAALMWFLWSHGGTGLCGGFCERSPVSFLLLRQLRTDMSLISSIAVYNMLV